MLDDACVGAGVQHGDELLAPDDDLDNGREDVVPVRDGCPGEVDNGGPLTLVE